MATFNFTTATPTSTTKLVGFDNAVAAGERTYTAGSLPVSTAQAAADAAVLAAAVQRANHTGTQAGTTVTNTPAGNVSATTVQAAINELDSEKAGLALNNTFTAAQAITLGVTSVTNAKSVTGSVNSFFEQNIQNTSNGASASSDFVVTANTGSETLEYVDLGINSSGFSGSWGGAKDGYLYASDNNLWIGTNTAAKNVIISAGNGGTAATATFASAGLTLSSALPVGSGGTGVTTSTGSGNNVLSTSPTLVTPVLGTPSSGTLTSCTGLPISTGVSGLATGVATFLATPTSANLKAAITDETGSGSAVFATSPTLVTPLLGTPTSGDLSNCTATTLSTTVSTTAPATTAFVQGVHAAGSAYATASISAAGNTNVAAASAQVNTLTTVLTVTAFTGTATITLQSTNAAAGHMRILRVVMPAGTSNVIDVRNLTSGGTALGNCPMDGALARTWVGRTVFDGTNWGAVNWMPQDASEYVTAMSAFRTDYVNSDGATANRAAGIYGPFDAVNNPREWVAGAASLTIAAVVTVPTSASDFPIVQFAPNSISQPYGSQNSLGIYFETSGGLVILQNGTITGTDKRRYVSSTNLRSQYSGQTGFLKIYIVQGTSTAPVITWNGVDISSVFLYQNGGTVPAWLDAAMTPTYRLVGYNWPSGPAPIVTPILGATSAADDAFYMQTGKWPAWVVRGGSVSNEILSASRNSNFSALATDYTAGSNCTVSAASGALVMTSNGTAGGQSAQLGSGNLRASSLLPGAMVRVYGNVSANTTGGAIRFVSKYGAQGFNLVMGTGAFDVVCNLTDADWVQGGFSISSSNQPASVVSFTVSSISIQPLGALSLPAVQPINVIDDVSGIGGNQGRLLGCSPVTARTDWTIRQDVVHAGADNKRILEGSLIDNSRDVIDSIEQTPSTGTPTTLLGSVSAGAQYKASSALSAGINPATLVTRKTATTEFWSQASTACLLRNTITGHRAN